MPPDLMQERAAFRRLIGPEVEAHVPPVADPTTSFGFERRPPLISNNLLAAVPQSKRGRRFS